MDSENVEIFNQLLGMAVNDPTINASNDCIKTE